MIEDLNPIPEDAPKPGSVWRHYKQKHIAVVLQVGYHTETGELGVFYRENVTGLFFFRPLKMWHDQIMPGLSRFTPIES